MVWEWEWCHAKQRNLLERSSEKQFRGYWADYQAVLNGWNAEQIR